MMDEEQRKFKMMSACQMRMNLYSEGTLGFYLKLVDYIYIKIYINSSLKDIKKWQCSGMSMDKVTEDSS